MVLLIILKNSNYHNSNKIYKIIIKGKCGGVDARWIILNNMQIINTDVNLYLFQAIWKCTNLEWRCREYINTD